MWSDPTEFSSIISNLVHRCHVAVVEYIAMMINNGTPGEHAEVSCRPCTHHLTVHRHTFACTVRGTCTCTLYMYMYTYTMCISVRTHTSHVHVHVHIHNKLRGSKCGKVQYMYSVHACMYNHYPSTCMLHIYNVHV